jgi:hypothetical protein
LAAQIRSDNCCASKQPAYAICRNQCRISVIEFFRVAVIHRLANPANSKRLIKPWCFNDRDASKFHHHLGGIIIGEMMAIPGTELWAKAILAACCKRDTTPDLGIRHASSPTSRSDFRCLRTRPLFRVRNRHLMAAAAFLGIVDSPHKVSFEPRQGRIENGPCGRDRGCGV